MENRMEIPLILAHDVSGLRFRWNAAVGVVNILGKRGGLLCLAFGGNSKEIHHWLRWPIGLCDLGKFGFPIRGVAIAIMNIEDPVSFSCLARGKGPVECRCIGVGCGMDCCHEVEVPAFLITIKVVTDL